VCPHTAILKKAIKFEAGVDPDKVDKKKIESNSCIKSV
jgi:hypothetical protein